MREIEVRGGRLTVEREGTQVHITAECPDNGDGLYKASAHGACGDFSLGALTQEKGMLRLIRRLPLRVLEQAGCWPITGGEITLVYPFPVKNWIVAERPEQLTDDPVLRGALAGQSLLLCRREDGSFTLAGKFDPCAPFPVPPLFCFARVERIEGVPYVLFTFDQNGIPIFPYRTREEGDNSPVIKPPRR